MVKIPEKSAGTKSATSDPDGDWMLQAETVPAKHFNPRPPKQRYIPAVPLDFIQQAQMAGDALALLLIALAEMRKRGLHEIAIGPGLWAEVGNPGKRVRARLLGQISRLPPALCTLQVRQGRPHLLKTGPNWPRSR